MTNDVQILGGDCRERLKELPDNSVDSIVTDPPYELGFMGKGWDNTGIAYDVGMWAECLRVLKPGGHLLAFSGTRTYHRMAVAIEDAGFEVRDSIEWVYSAGDAFERFFESLSYDQRQLYGRLIESSGGMLNWVYGSGFPKSLNIGKAIDKAAGAVREVVGKNLNNRPNCAGKASASMSGPVTISPITAPATPEAQQWEGWGTALKPAHEPICMARKPFTGTVAANVLEWGTGGINVDGCRVEGIKQTPWGKPSQIRSNNSGLSGLNKPDLNSDGRNENVGRFPANLIHDGSEEVTACFPDSIARPVRRENIGKSGNGKSGIENGTSEWSIRGKVMSGYYDNETNASRYFKSIIYQAKASKAERGEGNNHPTVKPKALIAYLIKLVTPPGGTVLDPFGGSGTTAVVCIEEGHPCITIDMMPEHIVIIKNRTANAKRKPQTLFEL